MMIFRYFVHYSFIGEVYDIRVRAHDEVIVELNKPVLSTSDLKNILRGKVAKIARLEMDSSEYPQAEDIRIESCYPWGYQNTLAYDKYEQGKD